MKQRCAQGYAFAALLLAWCASASGKVYGGDAGESDTGAERHAYFGDLHLHTSFSFDAYLGGARIDPDGAYRYARGLAVRFDGHTMIRDAPLDFLAVTDHAENLGVGYTLEDPTSHISQTAAGRLYHEGPVANEMQLLIQAYERPLDPQRAAQAWKEEIDAANRNYRPGRFTTLIGYEWASQTFSSDGGISDAIHRNVIFSGQSAPAPFTIFDSKKLEDLWAYLEALRSRGVDNFAITNHPTLSNGRAFSEMDGNGLLMDKAYANRRRRNEPLAEIFQHVGNSETHPLLSPADPFSEFNDASPSPAIARGSYVRDAYERGLVLERRLGINPFHFGVVGTSDSHSGLSPSGARAYSQYQELILVPDDLPGALGSIQNGLTGVWSSGNTRESIFASLKRGETFATSGTRLQIRLFGGWNFPRDSLSLKEWPKWAYTHSATMGGNLPARPSTAMAPEFAIWAHRAPRGANLDRLQIVKLWEEGGMAKEKVFDIAWSGQRNIDAVSGQLDTVGNTVNLHTGQYRNSIGAEELRTLWRDPEFDPALSAAYYARAIEIPTPRWSTLFAIHRRMPLPSNIPSTEQQRAWTSPIWFNPDAR